MTKLLSIDSSTSSTGYAIFVDGQYSRSGCIDLKNIKNSTERLSEMIRQLFLLIEKEKPDIVVAEEMVVARNMKTSRFLIMILGAVCGKCIDNNMFWYTLRPTEWRKLIPGEKPTGRDKLKTWSKETAKEMFGIEVNDDVSDAILVGQAYINMWN